MTNSKMAASQQLPFFFMINGLLYRFVTNPVFPLFATIVSLGICLLLEKFEQKIRRQITRYTNLWREFFGRGMVIESKENQ